MKRFLHAIKEALTRDDFPGNEPPDSIVGESEMERRDRRFWWVALLVAILILAATDFWT